MTYERFPARCTRPFPVLWEALTKLLLAGLAANVLLCGGTSFAKEEKDKKLYEDTYMMTKDGLKLRCRFYPGEQTKETVPVMIVHRFGGQGSAFYELAQALQEPENGGCAIIVPDLRGHGESTMWNPPGGEPIELRHEKMRRGDTRRIVNYDLEAVKKFLIEKNNLGELNIDMLCVIAVDTGTVFAMNWIVKDWSYQQLVGYRQGKDAKAFVLISPKQVYKGINVQQAITHPVVRSHLSALFLCGDRDSAGAGVTRRMYNALKRHHPQKWKSRDEQRRKQDLFLLRLDTSLQGEALVNQASLKVPSQIASFIDLRLVSHKEQYPWSKRENPFGN